LLADGTTMTIRPAAPGDYQAVLRLHEAMSPDNLYFRFFSASRVSAEREAQRVCLDDRQGLATLLGLRGDDLVGVASYELTGDPAAAEIALAVADGMHRRGIATLLLEHLVSLARARGVKTLVADVLPDNYPVLHVLADAGLTVRRRIGGGVIEISMPVPDNAALGEASAYLDAVGDREKRADVASLAPLLAPRSVAVVGAGRRPGSLGRTALLGIRDGGFPGALYAVGPHGGDIEGIRWVPSVADLPEAPDLAVVAVPPSSVVDVARECGGRGVRALAVITSGLTPEQESGLLAATRQGSMRLLGPASYGIAVPGIGLDAALAVRRPCAGKAGIAVQSGGVGAALAEQLSRLGIGTSSFASVGDMLDVSATDMLLWWGAREHRAGRPVPGVVRQRAPVRPDGPPGQRHAPHPDRPRRALGPRSARRRLPHRGGGRAADHPAGAVRPGGHHRHHQPRRADRSGSADGVPADPGGHYGRRRVQRRRGGGADRRRVRRGRPDRGRDQPRDPGPPA
jgi:GNAT superfamily N-acetyltransferase